MLATADNSTDQHSAMASRADRRSGRYRISTRLRIPEHFDHRFRSKLDSDSGVEPITFRFAQDATRVSRSGAERRGATGHLWDLPGPLREGPLWRSGGYPCARYERFCGCMKLIRLYKAPHSRVNPRTASSPTPSSRARGRRSPPATRNRVSASCCPGTSARTQAEHEANRPKSTWAVRLRALRRSQTRSPLHPAARPALCGFRLAFLSGLRHPREARFRTSGTLERAEEAVKQRKLVSRSCTQAVPAGLPW